MASWPEQHLNQTGSQLKHMRPVCRRCAWHAVHGMLCRATEPLLAVSLLSLHRGPLDLMSVLPVFLVDGVFWPVG